MDEDLGKLVRDFRSTSSLLEEVALEDIKCRSWETRHEFPNIKLFEYENQIKEIRKKIKKVSKKKVSEVQKNIKKIDPIKKNYTTQRFQGSQCLLKRSLLRIIFPEDLSFKELQYIKENKSEINNLRILSEKKYKKHSHQDNVYMNEPVGIFIRDILWENTSPIPPGGLTVGEFPSRRDPKYKRRYYFECFSPIYHNIPSPKKIETKTKKLITNHISKIHNEEELERYKEENKQLLDKIDEADLEKLKYHSSMGTPHTPQIHYLYVS